MRVKVQTTTALTKENE